MDQQIRFQRFLQNWFKTPAGQALYDQENRLIDKELARLFGYYLVQIGCVFERSLLQTSRVKTKLVLNDQLRSDLADSLVIADLDFLPLRHDSVDVVVMPHSLESVPDPYHLVRQVDAMLIADGSLIITGFNRFGCSVLRSRLGSARQEFKQANLLSMHRVIDWLNLLGYDIQVAQHGSISCFNKRSGRLSWFWSAVERFEQWLDRVGLHLGNVYIVVAKKRVVTPKPVGLDWKLANWLPVRKGRTLASCDRHECEQNRPIE